MKTIRRSLKELFNFSIKNYYKSQKKNIIHYLHIGKTGGSAFKYALTKDHFPRDLYLHKDFMLFLHSHFVHLPDIPKGEKVIFFLRNPISRFISGFNGRKREDRPRWNVPWTKEEKIAFENFDTPNELALALSSHDPQIKAKAEFAMNNIIHLKYPFVNWLKSKEYLLERLPDVLFFGFQEQMDQDYNVLKDILKIPDNIHLPTDNKWAHKNPAEFEKKLDAEAIKNLNTWYQDDIELYKFCKDIQAKLIGTKKVA